MSGAAAVLVAVQPPLSMGLVIVLNLMVLAVLLALAALAAGARLHVAARARHQRVVDGIWRPLLLETLVARPDAVPTVSPRVGPVLLRDWRDLRDQVRGDAAARLDDLAVRAGLPAVATRLLAKDRAALRVLAIEAAGHLRVASCWDHVVPALSAPGVNVNLAAAQALIRIDPDRAMAEVAPEVCSWEGVHPSVVAATLAELGAGRAARFVLDLIRDDAAGPMAWRIRLLGHLRAVELLPELLDAVSGNDNPEVLAAAAQVAGESGNGDARPFVRALLDHPLPFVRLRAAAALGYLGTFGDDGRLLDATADTNWWVRYRSAQALARLPFLSRGELEWWAGNHPDRYARDALELALRERPRRAGSAPVSQARAA